MIKKDFVLYWQESAIKDWNAVKGLFETKNYVQALFFVHLTLEKLLKAHWVKDNTENHPPKIHNLIYFIDNTSLELEEDFMEFARKINDFQLEGRYPDYQFKIFQICTEDFTSSYIEQAKSLMECLLKKLP